MVLIRVALCTVLASLAFACRTTQTTSPDGISEDKSDPANQIQIDTELGERLWEGEQDSSQEVADLISGTIQRRYTDNLPARRDAHPKAHGCVSADFQVNEALPEGMAVGVFQPGKTYKSWIRFSNGDSDPKRPDIKGDARGMAIKLTGVPGEKILESEREALTQDFIMINHPVFFIDNPADYVSLISKVGSTNPLVQLTAPLALGFNGALIARAITGKKIESPLHTRFWSMVPYQFGTGPSRRAIKFSAKPCFNHPNNNIPDDPEDNYLRTAMRNHLNTKSACFEFLVQPRTNDTMDVEKSTAEWTEDQAPFIKVATITINKQQFDSPAQNEFCENLSFTPWHALPEHRPLGAVNRVRRVVYNQISELRHTMNGAERLEPTGDEVFGP